MESGLCRLLWICVWLWDGSCKPQSGVGKALFGDGLAGCVAVDRLARGVRQPIAATRFVHSCSAFLVLLGIFLKDSSYGPWRIFFLAPLAEHSTENFL